MNTRQPDTASILPGMIDSHMHSREILARGINPATLMEHLAGLGCTRCVDVAIHPSDVQDPLLPPDRFPGVLHTCGLHPSRSGDPGWQDAVDLLADALEASAAGTPGALPVRAVGETGLDYVRDYAPRTLQRTILEAHLAMANRYNLPVIIHNRGADDHCREVLQTCRPDRGGIMHCFSSEASWAARFTDLGMYISFAGNVTFPSAHALREAAAVVPDHRILVETDAPFLAPQPRRGRTNHPGLIGYTYRVLAETRGVSVEDLIEQVEENFTSLFAV